jgi:hypothetical protein
MPDTHAVDQTLERIKEGLKKGTIVPYLGPGVLKDVAELTTKTPIPADSDSLILAMNDGKPMAPRLMYEFARAAMNVEQKKGRKFVEKFLTKTYAERKWSQGRLHQWLASLHLPYIVDINRDLQLQQQYANRPHTLILGTARLGGTNYRFKLFHYENQHYKSVPLEEVNSSLPILFKPMGSPLPEANYIASDADYVDYITELMGGFAIPDFLKRYRVEKQYVFLGMRMQRDTERMVLSDIIQGASAPAGWVLLPEPTDKERRFCAKKNLQIIEADWDSLVSKTDADCALEVVA